MNFKAQSWRNRRLADELTEEGKTKSQKGERITNKKQLTFHYFSWAVRVRDNWEQVSFLFHKSQVMRIVVLLGSDEEYLQCSLTTVITLAEGFLHLKYTAVLK